MIDEPNSLRQRALNIRRHILTIAATPEGTHLGGSLSAADILTVLYFHIMNIRPEEPDWMLRDYFILSKGHACAALYATLAERGFLSIKELTSYAQAGSRLNGHPTCKVPGVEFPTGSLGHGLSLAVGLALAAQRDGRPNRVFVLLGDGELQEGSVWEAVMAAAHFELDNIIAIVDRNHLQINGPTEQGMMLEPLPLRWKSFGWHVEEVDGHDLNNLCGTLSRIPYTAKRPSILIAHTIKGKGVKFLEHRKASHYVVLKADLYKKAWNELHNAEEDISFHE